MGIDRSALLSLCANATPGPWELQTSNSWRRIGTAGGRFADGNVLAPTTHRGDNHPDLAARQEDLDFIVAANPAVVRALLDEVGGLEADLAGYKMGAKAEADAGDEARAELRKFKALLVERETARIGQSLQRHDDQRQMDELVALGIQQDKDEIARLTRENDQWRRNYEHLLEQHMPRTGDGCQEGWSRVVEAQELQSRLSEADATSEKLRDLLRLVVSELPHRNSGSDGNAPGHGHRTPGVWDGDNGELSGRPCAWCAIWAAAKAEVAHHA